MDIKKKQSEWYRSIGDRYSEHAAGATTTLAKELNSSEAAKYYGIAVRLEAVEELADASN